MNTNHNDTYENLMPLCLIQGGNSMQRRWSFLRVSRLFKKLVHVTALLMLPSFVSLTSIATSYGFEPPRKELALYLQFSLSNSNGAVRKIMKTGPLAVQGVCKSSTFSRCNKSILNKQVNAAFGGNGRIKIRVTAENSDLKFIFLDAINLESKKRELSDSYSSGFNDSDDPECQLYYSIKDNVIKNVVVVVSLDSTELKQRFCLASQLFQGLGLSLQNDLPFSKLWKQAPDGLPNGQGEFTIDDVSKLTKGYAILSYIHMCPDIKPGMKADDINRMLLGNSVCLDGLEFLP
jgi:hypothetical protein